MRLLGSYIINEITNLVDMGRGVSNDSRNEAKGSQEGPPGMWGNLILQMS